MKHISRKEHYDLIEDTLIDYQDLGINVEIRRSVVLPHQFSGEQIFFKMDGMTHDIYIEALELFPSTIRTLENRGFAFIKQEIDYDDVNHKFRAWLWVAIRKDLPENMTESKQESFSDKLERSRREDIKRKEEYKTDIENIEDYLLELEDLGLKSNIELLKTISGTTGFVENKFKIDYTGKISKEIHYEMMKILPSIFNTIENRGFIIESHELSYHTWDNISHLELILKKR